MSGCHELEASEKQSNYKHPPDLIHFLIFSPVFCDRVTIGHSVRFCMREIFRCEQGSSHQSHPHLRPPGMEILRYDNLLTTQREDQRCLYLGLLIDFLSSVETENSSLLSRNEETPSLIVIKSFTFGYHVNFSPSRISGPPHRK